MTTPLTMSFDVTCSATHAFEVWTAKMGMWWPPDHTVSGKPDAVVLEAGVGGRIYERSADGVEYDWGEVTAWAPPTLLAYIWHIGQSRDDATEVEIRFLPRGATETRIEIEHRGWERLAVAGAQRREQNQAGWQAVLPHFLAAIARGEGP